MLLVVSLAGGAYLALRDEITIGVLVAFFEMLYWVTASMQWIATILPSMQRAAQLHPAHRGDPGRADRRRRRSGLRRAGATRPRGAAIRGRVRLRGRRSQPARGRPDDPGRAGGRNRRPERLRQEHDLEPAPALLRSDDRVRGHRRDRPARGHAALLAPADRVGGAGQLPLRHLDPRERPARASDASDAAVEAACRPAASTLHYRHARTATRRWSASGAVGCRAASGSGSRSRGPSCAIRRCCCSTRRRRRSTPGRGGDQRDAAGASARPDDHLGHAPARVGRPRGSHFRDRARSSRRAGPPRRTADSERRLRAAVATAGRLRGHRRRRRRAVEARRLRAIPMLPARRRAALRFADQFVPERFRPSRRCSGKAIPARSST